MERLFIIIRKITISRKHYVVFRSYIYLNKYSNVVGGFVISEVYLIERSGKLIYHNAFRSFFEDERNVPPVKKDLHLISGAIVALAEFAETVYNRRLNQLKFEDKMMHVATLDRVVVCIVTDGPVISALFLANKYGNILNKKLESFGRVVEVMKVLDYLREDIEALEGEIKELNDLIKQTTYI